MGYCIPFHTLHSIIRGIDKIFNEEIEEFRKMLENKMVEDAGELIKFTHNILLLPRSGDEYPGNRELMIIAFQESANHLNFKFDLQFEEADISHIKWYYKGAWIRPINGGILPIRLEKNGKPRRDPIPGVLRHEVFQRDGYRCLECGATNLEISLEVDHIIPVSQGGTDELSNLQTLCIICNRAKGTRTWRSPSISS